MLIDLANPVEMQLKRVDAGQTGNLEGYHHKVALPAGHGGTGIRSHRRDCLMMKLRSRPVSTRWLAISRRETLFIAWPKPHEIITSPS
jgi:hypothetical protein